METRRTFLAALMAASACSRLAGSAFRAQNPNPTFPSPPSPSAKPGQDQRPDGLDLPDPAKKALEDNDKDMKKKVERLYQLAAELKAEVDKTDSSKVMSLNLMKKAEAIEKLARDIKNHSKG